MAILNIGGRFCGKIGTLIIYDYFVKIAMSLLNPAFS